MSLFLLSELHHIGDLICVSIIENTESRGTLSSTSLRDSETNYFMNSFVETLGWPQYDLGITR